MEARLVNGHLLKKVVEAMKDLIRQGTWDCDASGLRLQSMDSAHVCLVSVSLEAEGFDKFNCERAVSLGVDMESMSKVMRCAAKDDIITLSSASTSPDTLKFTFEAADQERISEYKMKLMTIEEEHLAIPDTEYTAIVTLPGQELQRILRDLAQFGDTITIATLKDSVQFSANGSLGSGNIKLSQTATESEDKSVTIDTSEPVSLQFACRYLNMFMKAATLSTQVKVSLSNDIPLKMEFEIGKLGSLKYYLAPKIEDD